MRAADESAFEPLTADQLEPTVLAEGSTTDEDGTVLLGMTFPSGATGVWLLTYELSEYGGSSSVARLPHAPAGTALEDRLVSVPAGGHQIALHAPESAVRAEVLTAEGAVLGSVELLDGSYVGEVPGGSFAPSTDGAATVRALDATGSVVAEGPIDRVVTG
jgi:hypothetical protein